MTRIPIEELGDDARVWVFGATKSFDASVLDSLAEFVESWQSHGGPVTAAAEVLHNRFIVVAADEAMNPSGCSIDKLYRRIGELERETDARLRDSSIVFYQSAAGDVESTTRAEFKKIATPATTVFDLSVETLGDFRRHFARRAAESWHRELVGA